MSRKTTKFILALSHLEIKTNNITTPNGRKKIYNTYNANQSHVAILDRYSGYRNPSKHKTQKTSTYTFIPSAASGFKYLNYTDKTAKFLYDTGYTETYKLKRYRKSKNRISPKELRHRFSLVGSTLFTGTAKSQSDIDVLKASLILHGMHDVKIIDISCAEPIELKEL